MGPQLRQHDRRNRQGGFAIVVVLSSLLILTTLFAIASARSLAHLNYQSSEVFLADRHTQNTEVLDLLVGMKPTDLTNDTSLVLPSPFAEATLRLQDVGGLIDLNTASPELLELLFSHLDLPGDAAGMLRRWRREGRRLVRVGDLLRIVDGDPSVVSHLERVATVHSGRRGVSVADASDEMLAIVRDRSGNVPDAYVSPPSGVNFAVYRRLPGTSDDRLVGVISLGAASGSSRVLDVR